MNEIVNNIDAAEETASAYRDVARWLRERAKTLSDPTVKKTFQDDADEYDRKAEEVLEISRETERNFRRVLHEKAGGPD
jgi:hypothetical protein